MRRLLAAIYPLLRTQIGEFEGSTRPLALIRMGLAVIVLAEWGSELILVRDVRIVSGLLGASTLISAAALFVGLFTRFSTIWAAASSTTLLYVFGELHGRTFISNHTHMLVFALWLLALSPCGVSYSVDRWRESRQARRLGQPLSPERAFLWAQRLLVVHLSTVYFWSVCAKLVPGFLNGARLEHLFMGFYGTSEYPAWQLFHPLMVASAWAVIGTELFIGIGIWFRRTRPFAIGIGIVFHLALYFLLPVSTFSALVILLYLAAVDPDHVHRVIDEMSDRHPTRAGA